jgi:hypothetical protein
MTADMYTASSHVVRHQSAIEPYEICQGAGSTGGCIRPRRGRKACAAPPGRRMDSGAPRRESSPRQTTHRAANDTRGATQNGESRLGPERSDSRDSLRRRNAPPSTSCSRARRPGLNRPGARPARRSARGALAPQRRPTRPFADRSRKSWMRWPGSPRSASPRRTTSRSPVWPATAFAPRAGWASAGSSASAT